MTNLYVFNDDLSVEDEYINFDPSEWEAVGEPCPDCKSYALKRLPVADGPDDFRYLYECSDCGATLD